MLSSRLPLVTMIPFCRALRHQLEAGLTLAQAMKMQATKGPLQIRPIAKRIATQLAEGHSLRDALREERDSFPPLFMTITAVAEETGKLPEVLRELEAYFELQVQLWRKFLAMIAWPAIQFVLAILVLAALIWILGMIPTGMDGKPTITVFGLHGETHAILWLFGWALFLAGLFGGYWVSKEVFRSGAVDRFLIHVPVIGGCMRTLAIGRFSMGMALTLEAGVPTPDAAQLSLYATGNGAFDVEGKKVARLLREGQTLAWSLRESTLFPEEFLLAVENAEESGTEPEVFNRLAQQYHEKGTTALKMLAWAATGIVWFLVVAVLIYFIFSLVMQIAQPYKEAFEMLGM